MAQTEEKATWLLKEAGQVSKASLLDAARRESGLWLHTLPSSTLETLLDPKSLHIALALKPSLHEALKMHNAALQPHFMHVVFTRCT